MGNKEKNNNQKPNSKRTELLWEGKYDEKGDLKLPERVSLPFQVIETVNESKADREKAQLSFLSGKKDPGSWRNKLIWGDNNLVMSALLEEFAGKINLIYIDPPFATGADFSYRITVGGEEVAKEPSIIEEIAYRDTWGKGISSYLQMMYERLHLMRDLLAEDGSIYVHCDWHIGHYLKLILDEIFGKENFRNEVIWHYEKWVSKSKLFQKNHDTLLFYTKGYEYVFNEIKTVTKNLEEKYKKGYLLGGGYGSQGLVVYDKENLKVKEMIASGKYKVVFASQEGKPLSDVWDIPFINPMANERVNYNTQKPEPLLERIIRISSNENAIIADFFCGSGTALAVAEKITDGDGKLAPRRWIGCDLSRFAIQTTRKRLLEIENCNPFEVLNLGKYERQYWQASIVSGKTVEQRIDEYLAFILKLYKAEPLAGFSHLHGRKAGRLVHIGAVDAPVTLSEVEETIEEAVKADQKKIDILGWEFAFGVDAEVIKQQKARSVDIRLLHIPREVMNKRVAESGQVDFYDLGALELGLHKDSNKVQVEIKYFFIPNLDLVKEEEVRAKIKKWQDYIDYWSVDWDFKEDTFHNQWQDYRTRKDHSLKLKSDWHTYESSGKYQIVVKVIDVFGNDTTRLWEVEI